MQQITASGRVFSVERALLTDVDDIVGLLADDALGASRESGDLAAYQRAFAEIDSDPRQFLAVIKDEEGSAAGTLQLTLIPGLSRSGATRLLIEAVRIAPAARGLALGTAMLEWAHDYGRRNGASLAQLTSDKSRVDAVRYYERLGYTASHEGLKKSL